MRQLSAFSGVYVITHIPSGKKYVGCAADIWVRWYWHRNMLKRKKHHSKGLQVAWDADGESAFSVVILEECDGSKLFERERFWIREQVYDEEKGFNLRWKGGDWSDPEYKAMMSEAAEQRAASPEGRAQIKAARAKRKDYSKFGAYSRSFVKKVRNQFREWTAEDDKVLMERYGPDGAQAVATAMNRSLSSVYVRASKLGLKKGPGAAEQYRRASLSREARKREGDE